MSIDEVDVFFDRPHALALSPDGRYVYTASLAGNDIAIIDPVEERVELLKVPGPTHVFVQFAVSPDGSTLAFIARSKGRKFYDWWFFGAALIFVALPAALLIKPKEGAEKQPTPISGDEMELPAESQSP